MLSTMHPSAAYAYCAHSKPARAWSVAVAVLVLHALVIWAVQGGLRREAQAPELAAAMVVVTARLILQPSPAPVLLAPAPPATPAAPQAKPRVQPQATVPAAATPSPAPVPTPVPTFAPVLASAASAAPAFSTPSTPFAPVVSAALAAPGGPSALSTASVAHGLSAPVRVAAMLQASGTCTKPEYPELSRRREEQGSVQLKFLIAADGHVVESHIAQSSGYPRLDEAARAGLARCQFKPGTVDGKPEPSWASIKYTWRLE